MEKVAEIQEVAAPLLARADVAFAGVFGSVARGEANEGSDIDLLIRFRAPKSLLALFALQHELEDALGRPVDLVTERSLDARLRDAILRELTPIYGVR